MSILQRIVTGRHHGLTILVIAVSMPVADEASKPIASTPRLASPDAARHDVHVV